MKRDTRQLAFALQSADGLLSPALEQAAAMIACSIKDGPLSREQMCDRLGVLLGRTVSLSQFNAWFSVTNRNRVPADALVGLCFILDRADALDALLAPLGLTVATARERAFAELGRVQIEREQLTTREALARRAIQGER